MDRQTTALAGTPCQVASNPSGTLAEKPPAQTACARPAPAEHSTLGGTHRRREPAGADDPTATNIIGTLPPVRQTDESGTAVPRRLRPELQVSQSNRSPCGPPAPRDSPAPALDPPDGSGHIIAILRPLHGAPGCFACSTRRTRLRLPGAPTQTLRKQVHQADSRFRGSAVRPRGSCGAQERRTPASSSPPNRSGRILSTLTASTRISNEAATPPRPRRSSGALGR